MILGSLLVTIKPPATGRLKSMIIVDKIKKSIIETTINTHTRKLVTILPVFLIEMHYARAIT